MKDPDPDGSHPEHRPPVIHLERPPVIKPESQQKYHAEGEAIQEHTEEHTKEQLQRRERKSTPEHQEEPEPPEPQWVATNQRGEIRDTRLGTPEQQ